MSLSEVQKFCYLKTLLSDDAASVIDGLNVTHGNYSEAIHLLKERFGQTHKVVNAYMQGLLDLPRPTSQLSSLRPFQEKMEAYIRGLQSLGQGHESFGNLLIPVILEKLPAEIKRNMTRDHGGSEWRLPELRRALKKEINIIDSGQPTQTTYEHLATASFLTSTRPTQKKKSLKHIQEVQIPQRPQCPFCSEKHFANDCKNIINPRERKAIIHRKKQCFNCLGKHLVASCRSKHRCRKCNRKHHTSICDQSIGSSLNTSAPSFVPTSGSEATTHLTSGSSVQSAILHSATQSRNNVLLKTAVAEVTSGHACAKANILFDEGAQRSFITHELAETLQLQRRGSEVVHLAAFGAESKKVGHFETATVYLITDNSEKIAIDVLIVPSIAVPLRNQIRAATHLPYLRGLKLAHPVPEVDTFNISLLIGADRYWEIIGDRIIRGDGPTAVQSKIGFLLSGPLPVTSSSTATNYIMNIITSAPDYDDLERFWKLESIGILPEAEEKASDLHNYQKNCITFENDKYTASLPWKPDHPNLPDNYNITLRRTQNTIRRLREDPPLLQKYDGIIKDQEKRGFIEKVNVLSSERPVHYIPHHGVKKHSATTPIRIVFDCSCRQNKNSPSLNDCLESTPPEINELTSILVNLRKHRYAVCTDIEKAFLQIQLNENDRDVTRFLWLNDIYDPNSDLTTYRFKSVLFGATCSPFILHATLTKHLSANDHNWVSAILKKDLYVDNVMSSFSDESTLLDYFQNTRKLMTSAGFNLRSWSSNNSSLRSLAEAEAVAETEEITNILGMKWDPISDQIFLAQKTISTSQFMTKRVILKETAKIYDPLGFLTPLTIRAKILLQDIWKQKFEWDMSLPDDLQTQWYNFAKDLNSVIPTRYPRSYFKDTDSLAFTSGIGDSAASASSDIHLHVFWSASL
ncbi:uncharacterized protein LOC132750656 [Ruditapes philippinarum]|uniref:uncharacterized protein LOC132750656 n=1 Tax=Ruditapes philippinarum TaxID=129788 RepID=UPI00295C343B|nr:uncharacterized protein LOC132750656 [Ruditapes philippinarum]